MRSLKASCIRTYSPMLYTQHIGYRASDYSFWSTKQPLPEQQQPEQESEHKQRMFFTQQDTAPVAGKFQRNCQSCNRLQSSDGWQEEASPAQSKSTHPKASVVRPCRCSSQSPEKVIEMLSKLKAQLKIVCAGDLSVLYHFCTFSNVLNLPEVKPHPLLLLSRLSLTFS